MLKKAWLSLLLLSALGVQAQKADHYWQWGWGDYGAGRVEDVARFDWSLVNFGSVPDNEETVARLNEILSLNPNHRFVIRIWPTLGLGKLPNNRYQATLWDYFYSPEVKERIRGKIRHQFELLHSGLSRPEAIVGMTYLEELPQHFTSCPFKSKITQAFMPWDMAPFEKEISAELGHPFDISKEEDALWWGKKYCQYLNEVHQYMRSIAPNCKILYWQATYYNTLDRADKKLLDAGVMPFYIEDLLKEGNCDGIFGYPNNDLIWQKQTMDIVQKHNCLFFSQVSIPSGMRLTGFSDTVERTRVKHPGNLGTFIFTQNDSNIFAWNIIPDFKGKTNLHISDHQRWFGRRYQVGLPMVKQILQPRLYLSYDFRNKAPGDYATVSATLYNPRNKSWFGGDENEAILKNVELQLAGIPDGYTLPPEANSPRVLRIESLGGEEVIEATWWLQKGKESDSFSPQQLQVAVQADGVEKTAQNADGMQQSRSMNAEYAISRTGERWLMISGGGRGSQFHLELESLRRTVNYPRLTFNDQQILYRDSLAPGDRLLLYPGVKATLLKRPLIPENIARFRRADTDVERVFEEGYHVFSSPAFRVNPNREYIFTITGFVSDKGILNSFVEFTGKRDGKPHKESVRYFNPLGKELSTVKLPVQVPAFDANSEIKALVRFYRHEQTGKLHLREFNVLDGENRELDVTDRLDGFLNLPTNAIMTVVYDDRDTPNFFQHPLLNLKLVDSNEIQQAAEQRKGGGDF